MANKKWLNTVRYKSFNLEFRNSTDTLMKDTLSHVLMIKKASVYDEKKINIIYNGEPPSIECIWLYEESN